MASSDRHRDFSVASETRKKQPVTFTLEGQEFECVEEAPAAALTDFLGDVAGDHVGRSAAALVSFITSVLIDEDVPRFLDLVHSKETIIPIETVGEIVTWLVEEYSGRPTVRPSRSRGGPRTTPAGSTDDSASLVNLPSATSRSAAR